jgi:two-component system, NarL family, nitrate/nitrite response regulator NarL
MRRQRRAHRATRAVFRLFIFSQRAIYCESLRLLLTGGSGLRIVGSTDQWPSAVSAVRTCRPHVILLDLHAPHLPDSRNIAALLAACRSARMMVLAPQLDGHQVTEALRLGIRGVVWQSENADTLVRSIRAVAAGEYWIDRAMLVGLVRMPARDERQESTDGHHRRFGLTDRELDIVSSVLGGSTNRQIGERCGITEKTVKRHLTNIFEKVGLSNRLALALFALKHQLTAAAPTVAPIVRRDKWTA